MYPFLLFPMFWAQNLVERDLWRTKKGVLQTPSIPLILLGLLCIAVAWMPSLRFEVLYYRRFWVVCTLSYVHLTRPLHIEGMSWPHAWCIRLLCAPVGRHTWIHFVILVCVWHCWLLNLMIYCPSQPIFPCSGCTYFQIMLFSFLVWCTAAYDLWILCGSFYSLPLEKLVPTSSFARWY